MLRIKSLFAFILFFSISIISIYAQQNIGDTCAVQVKNNAPGECLILKDCPEAIDDIRNQRFPQICGFQGTVPIVCCSKKAKPTGRPGDISLRKCKEYGKSVFEEIELPIFGINVKPVTETTCTHTVTPLVVGGENATAKEFPHMALLGYGLANAKSWQCGGSLISEQFVLTAGHCLSSPQDGPVRWIRLGDLNIAINTDDARPEEFSVQERIKHPQYIPPSRYNDIALLKMDRPVSFSQYIRPACLFTATTTRLRDDQRYIATGWGLTQAGGQKGADHLQKVVLDNYVQSKCNETYESNISRRLKFGIIPESQLCAGGTDKEKDTCQGDSGGPLQLYSDVHCMYDIVGVTSFGKSCAIRGIPGVYSRVSNYLEWIENTVWP